MQTWTKSSFLQIYTKSDLPQDLENLLMDHSDYFNVQNCSLSEVTFPHCIVVMKEFSVR